MSNDAQQVIDLARELGVNLQPWQESDFASAGWVEYIGGLKSGTLSFEIDPTTGKYRRMEFMMPRRYLGFTA